MSNVVVDVADGELEAALAAASGRGDITCLRLLIRYLNNLPEESPYGTPVSNIYMQGAIEAAR